MHGVNTQIEEALEILKSGNRQDAERALETLRGVVYGFGMKVCGSHEDAQDTAQETLIRLARRLREFPTRGLCSCGCTKWPKPSV